MPNSRRIVAPEYVQNRLQLKEYQPVKDFALICMIARGPLESMMQAALVRDVAYASFASNPKWFDTHPANVSLTWAALEALEGSCIVELVECFRKPLHKPHIPASVYDALEKLIGHRDLVSHPFMDEDDWTSPRMKQFEADGRRYESRVPLVWALQRSLNAELANEGSPTLSDFFVTAEMSQLLRQIFVASLSPANIPRIPDDDELAGFLQKCREGRLKQCQEISDGIPRPRTPETPLDRMWAAMSRGEDPNTSD